MLRATINCRAAICFANRSPSQRDLSQALLFASKAELALGVFKAVSDDYRSVMFYADPGTGNRKVKVVVGIGDGRGYVDKKAFLLDGNSKTE